MTVTDPKIAPQLTAGAPLIEYGISQYGVTRTINFGGEAFVSNRTIERTMGADLSSEWWLDFLQGNLEHPEKRRGSVSMVDLFCGSGGLSLGVSLAAKALGLDVNHEFAADADPTALGIYRTNFNPRHSSVESIANLASYQLRTTDGKVSFSHPPVLLEGPLQNMVGDIDVVLAGPPCQGHSTVNNHTRFNDPRNLLYLSVPAIAVALRAKTVIIENVPGVTASREGVVQRTVDLLHSSGYSVTTFVLKSDAMGWPQTRKRFFLVASLDWQPVELEEVQTALERTARPISWALADLLETSEQSIMTESPVMSAENVRRINFLHDNQDSDDLPDFQRPDCHKEGNTYKAVYGRMNWDKPAPTLTTGFMTPGRGRYVHPKLRRTLVPREAARIQGFPDNYRFELRDGSRLGRTAIAKGIGDAVPTPLGFAAGLSALLNRPGG